ncbi:MAG: DNA mismatch repair protein MutS [Defluviitaleaceae bacterium]|nr:DNA mismatch repair protein MutS [Defluviitaleaceae bacterium]
MKRSEFINQVEKHEEPLRKYNALANKVGYIKLLLVLIVIVLVFIIFAQGFPLGLILLGVAVLIGLVVLWVYHSKLHEKIAYHKGIVAINKRHLDRISGKWTDFLDTGEEFIDREHPYSGDLDIVGRKSLFQFLNTTHTWYGRKSFAEALLGDKNNAKWQESGVELSEHGFLLQRQEAIKELGLDIEFANDMEYSFSKVGGSSAAKNLADEIKNGGGFIASRVLKYMILFMPIVTVLCIGFAIILDYPLLNWAAIILVGIQGLLWLALMGKILSYLKPISRLPYSFGAYSGVIENIIGRDFVSERLNYIKDELGASELSAKKAIKELGGITDKVSLRYNSMLWFIANVLLMWDFWCAVLFERWKNKYSCAPENWFLGMGEFESLLCFSVLPNVCGNTCLPSVTAKKAVLAKELGHPLISGDVRVNNDIACDENILIISGSNMSGKTTFMRTVGVNLVLARAGSFVCAGKMDFPLIRIMTSMRIADDLGEGISTFYAELRRIKNIISLAEEGPMLFFIDEIFRGTNSIDRLQGAKTVLTKLHSLGAIGVITTHDLELCDVAAEYPRMENFSFCEEYSAGEICFDYKIREGKSTTTNARFLMELVGIT